MVGDLKKVHAKGLAKALTFKALNQPPKMADPKGLCPPCILLHETKIFDTIVLVSSLDICMHFLNGIILLQDRKKVPVGINDAMRFPFERLTLVRHILFLTSLPLFIPLAL